MMVKKIHVTSLEKDSIIVRGFRKPLVSVLKRFLEETSLPGWKYLITTDKISLKLVWMITLVFTCLFTTFSMVQYTDQFLKSSIITSIDSTIAPIKVRVSFFYQ